MTSAKINILFGIFLLAAFFCLNAHGQTTQCENFQEALNVAAKLRGISPAGGGKCTVLEEKEFNRRIETLAHSNLTPEAIEGEELIAKALSLVPPSFPYKKCIYNMADPSIIAVYDHLQKDIILRSSKASSFPILVHEAVHMLQDRKYDLKRFYKKFSSTTDMKMAVGAIVEGDAMRIQRMMEQDLLLEQRVEEQGIDEECILPPPMADILYFPYEFEALYFNRARELKDFDSLFGQPPANTAAVLNPSFKVAPSKLHDEIRTLCSEVRGKCYKVIHTDTLGQYYLQSVLSVFLEKADSLGAAVGWQNDRIWVGMNQDRTERLPRWKLETTSEKNTIELWKALIKWVEMRNGVSLHPTSGRILTENSARSSSMKVVRTGDSITLEVFSALKQEELLVQH